MYETPEATPEAAPALQETPQLKALKAGKWQNEIKTSKKNQEKWHTQARRIVRRFLDRRDANEENENRINLFTSNTQILISTLYARFPKPLVTREYDDPDDDVARVASEIIERNLKIRPRDDFDSAMRYVVQDRLVPGVGAVWLRYESVIEQQTIPAVLGEDGTELSPASTYDKVTNEKVATDYVYYEDLLWSPARVWEDVRWVGRRVRMVKADVVKRFGKVVADQVSFSKDSKVTSKSGENTNAPDADDVRYADIYEIWDKTTKTIFWICDSCEYILDKREDPMKLDGFFPTPKFLMSLTATGNYMPRPDFLLAKDQYDELDSVNNRITWIERAIRVIGVYDGNNAEIERLFTEGVDNKIIPTRSFSDFMEKGGMKGAIDWFPIEMLVNALEKLRVYRQDLVSQIYELTGISDIMRGATKASETAAAQQLKAQYGSVKLQFIQMEVSAFVEEALQIKSEIIANLFSPETIAKVANVSYMYDQELIQKAIELIKSKELQYRVEVHADSMAVPEFSAERDDRMGFIRSIAEMMTAAAPILEKDPMAGAAMLEVVKWGAASFRSGKTIEGVLDKAIQGIQKAANTPKPPTPPTPTEQATIMKDQATAQLNQAKAIQTQVETGIMAETGGKPAPTPTVQE